MGRPNFPIYGEDVGSAIEDVEVVVQKIKTNKYTEKDLAKLVDACQEIMSYLNKDENKD